MLLPCRGPRVCQRRLRGLRCHCCTWDGMGETAWGCWPCPQCLLHLLILFFLLMSGLVVALALGATASVGGKGP